jgi:glycosyltransferase involved in cell wall biosynthesis
MIRIGLYANQLARWNGGLEFFQRLLDSLLLSSLHRDGIKVFLIIGIEEEIIVHLSPFLLGKLKLSRLILSPQDASMLISSIREKAVLSGYRLNHQLYANLVDLLSSYHNHELMILFFILSRPWALQLGLTYLRIQVLLPLIEPLQQRILAPYIAYIYDLQHVHMPWNFSREEREGRAACFSHLTAQAHALMLNSQYMLREFSSYSSLSESRLIFSLPFAPQARPEWLDVEYVLPIHPEILNPYLIVSNQFWIHKNHLIVLEAFERISQHYDLDLVFTGSLHDYRGHDHISSFLDKVSKMPTNNRIHVLGNMPKPQQIHFLRNATMLIQPSTYEGGPGGGAAYDAIALGVPILLSDIEVNRECRSPWYLDFFSPNNPSDLARKISKYMNTKDCRKCSTTSNIISLTDESRNAIAQAILMCCKEILGHERGSASNHASSNAS